ncbi:MAG: tol-pal system YbgF family protein [Armatimonadota bacterium]
MPRLIWMLVGLLAGGPALGEQHFRFDIGTRDSPVAQGWTQVLAGDAWDPGKGYGFEPPQTRGFHQVLTIPLMDHTRDGVQSPDDMSFRFAVPRGAWWVEVGIGHGRETREHMYVTANGVELAHDVTTRFTSWEGYPTTWGVAGAVPAPDGLITISLRHQGQANCLLYVEAVPDADRTWEEEVEAARTQATTYAQHVTINAVVGAIEQQDWERAADIVRNLSPDFPSLEAAALMLIAGRLETDYPADVRMVRRAERLLEALAAKREAPPGTLKQIKLARNFLRGRTYARVEGYSFVAAETPAHGKREWITIEQMGKIPSGHPLYHKAQFDIGRIHYWRGREGGDRAEYQKAEEYFRRVAEAYPDHRLVRMYLGEKVDWGTEYTEGTEGAPRWAVLQREALCRVLDVISYWVKQRQAPNGELGGWWGDDCEMLRDWPVAVLAVDDQTARRGWKRLADGIWSESGIIENGFNRNLRDVQHAAEPTSDTQPVLIGADYGNPVYVERCMQTMKCMRDVWTGLTARGHRHFRSSDISATEVNPDAPNAVDLPYCARAVKPGMWLAWYNHHPAATKLLCEWSQAWNEDAMRTDKGKPQGVPPAAVAFAGDVIGGYGDNWYEPGLYWSYFNFAGGLHHLFEQMLATYGLTGDRRYVAALESCLALADKWHPNYPQSPQPGSEAWAVLAMGGLSSGPYSKWRMMTGVRDHDDYLRERGERYLRFLLTGDKKMLESICESTIAGLRYNFEMLTSEVRYTDRVGLGAAQELFAMYTGAPGNPTYYPAYAVTWERCTKHFAALVLEADDTKLRVLAHNFRPQRREVTMRLWRLAPGTYRLTVGPDRDLDDHPDAVTLEREVQVRERGQRVAVDLPSRELQAIELTQLAAGEPLPELAPDLALGHGDLRVTAIRDRPGWLRATITVHNIGSAQAPRGAVIVNWADALPSDPPLGVVVFGSVPAPLDLDPKTATARLDFERPGRDRTLLATARLTGPDAPREITLENNRHRLQVKATAGTK